jgi:hypothetical protein
MSDENELPAYSYVPGGPWPHPSRNSEALVPRAVRAVSDADWCLSALHRRGIRLFNAGYYWEAHEAWETLWHAEGRKGAIADLLRGLIKLAAAGVKVRERQPHGIVTHAKRAADMFEASRIAGGDFQLGLDLPTLIDHARMLVTQPPVDPTPPGTAVVRVMPFEIRPC